MKEICKILFVSTPFGTEKILLIMVAQVMQNLCKKFIFTGKGIIEGFMIRISATNMYRQNYRIVYRINEIFTRNCRVI